VFLGCSIRICGKFIFDLCRGVADFEYLLGESLR